MNIVIVCGSNRAGSRTRLLADFVSGLYRERGVEPQLLDLAELPEGLLAPTAYKDRPEGWARFGDAICAADGVVILAPEYNGSMPGALKLFIDMLKFPDAYESRPISFIGVAAGQWGGLRPVEHLQQVFGYRNAFIFPKRIFIAGSYQNIGDDGVPNDEAQRDRLGRQADGFLAFCKALKDAGLAAPTRWPEETPAS